MRYNGRQNFEDTDITKISTQFRILENILIKNNQSYYLVKHALLNIDGKFSRKSSEDNDGSRDDDLTNTLEFTNDIITNVSNMFGYFGFQKTKNYKTKEKKEILDVLISKNFMKNNIEKIRNEFSDILETSNNKFLKNRQNNVDQDSLNTKKYIFLKNNEEKIRIEFNDILKDSNKKPVKSRQKNEDLDLLNYKIDHFFKNNTEKTLPRVYESKSGKGRLKATLIII